MKYLRSLSALAMTASVLATVAMPVYAQSVTDRIGAGLTNTAKESGYTTGVTDLPTLIGRLIGLALSLLGVLLVVYILYGGFTWMTAGGDEKKVAEAKGMIKNAVIGIVVIVSAYAISTFVLSQLNTVLTGATGGVTPKPTP